MVIRGLGSSITSLRKKPASLWQFESFCHFFDSAERCTLAGAIRVTVLPTDGKSLNTACDTDIIDDKFVYTGNVVLVPMLD